MTKPEKVSSASSLILNGRRILVVENSPKAAFLLTTVFEEVGAQVIQTNLTSAALVALEQEQPDIIICNIQMAEEDGSSFIKKLHAYEFQENKKIPAIGIDSSYFTQLSGTTVKEVGFQLFRLCLILRSV